MTRQTLTDVGIAVVDNIHSYICSEHNASVRSVSNSSELHYSAVEMDVETMSVAIFRHLNGYTLVIVIGCIWLLNNMLTVRVKILPTPTCST